MDFGYFLFAVVPTDCIVEGEVLKLGGPFLQSWQKKHLKLYPNRLEFYHKTRDGQVVRGKNVEVWTRQNWFKFSSHARRMSQFCKAQSDKGSSEC